MLGSAHPWQIKPPLNRLTCNKRYLSWSLCNEAYFARIVFKRSLRNKETCEANKKNNLKRKKKLCVRVKWITKQLCTQFHLIFGLLFVFFA